MKIIYIKEEGEVADVADINIDNSVIDTNLPDNSIESPIKDIPTDIDNELSNTSTQISNNITNNINTVRDLDRKLLPPPNRANYDYRIVPYYIPVGTRNYYRYRDNYLDNDRLIIKDIIDKDFRFKDGSYGIFCKYEGITIKAGSRPNNRKNLIIVDIEGDTFIKRVKDSDRTRKIVSKLLDILYYEDEEELLKLLIKYKFS